ncbi:hypothetical protein, partial [Klebsiella aerogenes]|uniref:hypothetical protein n=1 Tax=Klebsiella aerogenes TaxID=548 RepID=UPI001CC41E2F
ILQAKLFDFEKAADLLDRLVKLKPQEVEAWRLLGETTLLAKQSSRAVAAYEQAVALRDGDLQVTTVGLAQRDCCYHVGCTVS